MGSISADDSFILNLSSILYKDKDIANSLNELTAELTAELIAELTAELTYILGSPAMGHLVAAIR